MAQKTWKVSDFVWLSMMLVVVLVLTNSCATLNQVENTADLKLNAWGLFRDSGKKQLELLESTEVLPRKTDNLFGLDVVNTGTQRIHFQKKVYAKKFNEDKEQLMVSDQLYVDPKQGSYCLIGFDRESDFEFEYWKFQIVAGSTVVFEKTFTLADSNSP